MSDDRDLDGLRGAMGLTRNTRSIEQTMIDLLAEDPEPTPLTAVQKVERLIARAKQG
jgi:hypothetical protein